MTRRPRNALAPTLFPFLAVLVCTLGTLILLLALVAQKARDSAEEAVESHTEATRLAAEEQRWQADQLIAYRDQQTAELERKRAELAHLEDHLRRLRDSLTQLAAEAEAAEKAADEKANRDSEMKLASLRKQIDAEKQAVRELKDAHSKRPPRVIILPYSGTHGTQRRPIYVECTDRAVIIQPEGVRITPEQLAPPLGPGNPLDAALRTVRSHWTQLDPDSPPPYPLLLVRPGGIHAYAACRTAMTAWDDQFGYELIPAELELAFPKADPTLAPKLVESIQTAVLRQRTRIASAPRRYSGLVVDASGGLGEAPGHGAGDGLAPASGDGGSGIGDGTDFGAGTSTSTSTSAGTGTGGGAGRGPALRPPGQLLRARDGTVASTPSGGDALAAGESMEALAGSSGASEASSDGDSMADAGSGAADEGRSGTGGASNPLSGGGGTLSSGRMTAGGGTSSSTPPAPGAQTAASGVPTPMSGSFSLQSGESQDPHAKTFSDLAEGYSSPTDASSESQAETSGAPVLRAGNDWAMPESVLKRRGVTIVRQIQMRCDRGEFVLMPEPKSRELARHFPVRDEAVEDAVIRLATALRDRVEGWGMAMRNGRWEPVLRVTVAPGAEARFRQLEQLMRGSGIRVEKEAAQ